MKHFNLYTIDMEKRTIEVKCVHGLTGDSREDHKKWPVKLMLHADFDLQAKEIVNA